MIIDATRGEHYLTPMEDADLPVRRRHESPFGAHSMALTAIAAIVAAVPLVTFNLSGGFPRFAYSSQIGFGVLAAVVLYLLITMVRMILDQERRIDEIDSVLDEIDQDVAEARAALAALD